MHVRTHTHTHTHICTHTHARTHARTHTHTHTIEILGNSGSVMGWGMSLGHFITVSFSHSVTVSLTQGVIFVMVSGQMWNQIRGPPFAHRHPQTGEVVSLTACANLRRSLYSRMSRVSVFRWCVCVCARICHIHGSVKLCALNCSLNCGMCGCMSQCGCVHMSYNPQSTVPAVCALTKVMSGDYY